MKGRKECGEENETEQMGAKQIEMKRQECKVRE